MEFICIPEFNEVKSSEKQNLYVLVHLRSPTYSSEERNSRAPIAVSAVVDKSGSMEGSKIELVKSTMNFVINNLKNEDQLGVLAFNNSVDKISSLTRMTPESKKTLEKQVKSIKATGGTNLSDGLFSGINQLRGFDSTSQKKVNLKVITYLIKEENSFKLSVELKDNTLEQFVDNVEFEVKGQKFVVQTSPFEHHLTEESVEEFVVRLNLKPTYEESPIRGQAVSFVHKDSSESKSFDLNLVENQPTDHAESDVCAVWLFTDGLANSGIQDKKLITDLSNLRLASLNKPCSIFTFGFGKDHDNNLLQTVAENGNGLYYYVETEDKIPEAFADCLGGLLSVAAQNIHIQINCVPGCKIVQVHTQYPKENRETEATINLKDLYSEEERDIILEIELDEVQERFDGAHPILQCQLSYYDVVTCSIQELACQTAVARPELVGPQEPVPQIDRQRNRIRCVEALRKGKELADNGQLDEGRKVIEEEIKKISESYTAADPLCAGLINDLNDCLSRMQTRYEYQTTGTKTMGTYTGCHTWQRSCGSHGGYYANKSKQDMIFSSK